MPHDSRSGIALLLGLLVVAGCVAYHNSFSGPFVFDDFPAVRDNPTLHDASAATVLSPPQNTGVGGRPLANLSFALNYAVGGADVYGYHVVNLLLHLGSAWLLFGILRRTISAAPGRRSSDAITPSPRTRAVSGATGTAFVVSLLWTVHPLATASVSYISQRTELLMGFFYLLTLYAFIRGQETRGRLWPALSILACALGMMSKEVMMTAPVVVALYDRTFRSGTFRAAWGKRWRYYSALAATWLLLGYLLTTRLEQRGVGFGLGVSPLQYALAESEALVLYAKQVLWPWPLVFDYGRIYPTAGATNIGCVILLLLALWQVGRAVRRRSGPGFLAACFFLLLSPSSSFVPVADQPIAENRMYLPLAAGLTLAVLAVRAMMPVRIYTPGIFGAVGFCTLTIARNVDYASETRLWSDTVRKRPQNPRGQFNYGIVLLNGGRAADAVPHFERAVDLDPGSAEAHNSLGNAMLLLGRAPEAVAHYGAAVQLRPDYARAWYNYGTALFRAGDGAGAIPKFEAALRLAPGNAEAHNNLGNVYFQRDDPARAIPHYEAALALDPQLADAHYNCGNACLDLGRLNEAVAHLAAAARLKPDDPEVRNTFGAALVRSGRAREGVAEFEHALRLKPDYEEARSNLQLMRSDRVPEK